MLLINAGWIFAGKTEGSINQMLLDGTYIEHDSDKYELSCDLALWNYAETKHTYGFIPVGTDQHYMVMLYTDSSYEHAIICSVKVKSSSDIKTLDNLVEYSWSDDDSLAHVAPLFDVSVNTLSGEIKTYYHDGLDELFGDVSDMESEYGVTITDYEFDATGTRLGTGLLYFVFLLLGLFCIYSGLKQSKQLKEAESAPRYGSQYGTTYDQTQYGNQNAGQYNAQAQYGNQGSQYNAQAQYGSQSRYGTQAQYGQSSGTFGYEPGTENQSSGTFGYEPGTENQSSGTFGYKPGTENQSSGTFGYEPGTENQSSQTTDTDYNNNL